MKSITHDRLSELKSFFIGEPTEQAKLWVEPTDDPNPCLSGEGLDYQDGEWVLDYGQVPASLRTERRTSIENPGQNDIVVKVEGGEEWLGYGLNPERKTRNLIPGGERLILETVFHGRGVSSDREWRCRLRIIARNRSGREKSLSLLVKLTPREHLPYAVPDFDGNPEPAWHDFPLITLPEGDAKNARKYRFSLKNAGTETLEAVSGPAPKWLKMESISGEWENGRLTLRIGPGDEATIFVSPVASPEFAGANKGHLVWHTNDVREKYRQMLLSFRCRQEIRGPYVTFEMPEPVMLMEDQPSCLEIPMENWGKTPAHLSVSTQDQNIRVSRGLLIPGAKEDGPGKVSLRVDILAQSKSRTQAIIALNVLNGSQPRLEIPLDICFEEEKEAAEGKICPGCSLVLPWDYAFCPLCGASAEQAEPILKAHVRVCPVCGRKYKEDMRFCSDDGSPLERMAESRSP